MPNIIYYICIFFTLTCVLIVSVWAWCRLFNQARRETHKSYLRWYGMSRMHNLCKYRWNNRDSSTPPKDKELLVLLDIGPFKTKWDEEEKRFYPWEDFQFWQVIPSENELKECFRGMEIYIDNDH